jgi:hypothetical protein
LLDFVLEKLSNTAVDGQLVHREYNTDSKVRRIHNAPQSPLLTLSLILPSVPVPQVLEYRLEQLAADDPRIAVSGSSLFLPLPSTSLMHQPTPHTPRYKMI